MVLTVYPVPVIIRFIISKIIHTLPSAIRIVISRPICTLTCTSVASNSMSDSEYYNFGRTSTCSYVSTVAAPIVRRL